MDESGEAEVVFAEVFVTLRRSVWLIIVLTTLGALVAGGFVLVLPKKYEASTIVFAASSDSGSSLGGGLSSLASQFSGLAALAGVTPQTDSKKAEALAVLQSEQLTQLFISENDLLPILYAKRWDAANKNWRKSVLGGIPSLWKANALFRKSIRSITTDNKTGMVTLTIAWTDPVAAAKWANGLIRLENTYLRDKAIRESEANITYLNKQVAATDVLGIKQGIYAILQNEINKEMIARGSEEYALKVVDPAFVPERPSFPIPVLWVTVGALIGFFVAAFIAFLRKEQRSL